MSVPLEKKCRDPSLTSLQRRNLSRLSGVGLHSFEFFYCGPLSHDVVVTCDLFLEKRSILNNDRGRTSVLDLLIKSVSECSQPEKVYELFGIITSFFAKSELISSMSLDFKDWPTLEALINSCELFEDVFAKTPLSGISSGYFRYIPQGDDGVDKLEALFILN